MSSREDRVGEAVAWYFQAAEAADPPDPAAFLARFPDLRPELESFLADKGAFDRAAGPPAPARPDPDATLPPSNPNNDPDATVAPAPDPNATVPHGDSTPTANGDRTLGSVHYFEDYELVSEIARGGMGVVFRARQVSLNREVALKMILTGQLASAADVIRFRAEAEAAANLDHPNVLPIYEVGEHQGQQYFAMKLVPGGSLSGKVAQWLNDPRAAVGVFVKVCRAVDFAHRRGILHRDLKPGNILLDLDGTPYVTDFGLAKKVDGDSNLTQSGAILGTPSFMAPEQARAEKALTTAADVYALGAILYELLTGRPPFRGATVLDTILQVLEKEAPDPRTLNPKADRDLSVIALKCLEKNPSKRYESAGALADDLDRWARGEPIVAREVTHAERALKWVKRNPVVAALAASVVLALAAGATVGYLNYRDARIQEGIARAKAEDADREAAEATRQKGLADERATDAAREAAEARRQKGIAADEAAEATRQKGIASEKTLLATAAAQRATDAANDLAAQLKATRRVLDLSRLQEAQAAFDNNLVQVARDLLADVAPENRCPVWGLLNRRFEGSLFTLYGHTGHVTSVAVSADGSRIVTGSEDKTARVWDVRTGQCLTELKGHTDAVLSVAVSADGSRVVTGSWDKTARVWETRTGRFLELKGHTHFVTSVALSADGSRVVTGSWDNTARVWQVPPARPEGFAQPAQCLAELKGHTDPVNGVAVSADGSRVVTGSHDNTARVWEVPSARPEGVARAAQCLIELKGHTWLVSSVAVSADGSRVVTGSWDKTARVWDARTGQPVAELKGHTQMVNSVALSADGSRVATGSHDNTARVWEVPSARPEGFATTAQCLAELKGHTGAVHGVALSADGSRLVTGSHDNTARVWDARTGQSLPELKGHTAEVTSAALSADGSRVVTGSHDKTARVWDARTGQPLAELTGHTWIVSGVAMSADGSRVVTGSWDKTARVWEVPSARPEGGARTGPSLFLLKGHTGLVTSVAMSADGSRVVTGSFDKTARVWDARTGQFLVQLKGHTGDVHSVAMSADGSRVVTGSFDNTARVWDARTGQPLAEFKGHTAQVSSVGISADGSRVVTGSWDHTARVWEVPPAGPEGFARIGQSLLELKGHTNYVNSVALSADGSRVVTGSWDKTVRVWNATTGQSLTELKGHTDRLRTVALSADGSRLVTGSYDRTTRVWDARLGLALAELRGHREAVESVAVSADGSRIVTRDGGKVTLVWDSATGKPIPGEPVPPVADGGNRTPDGKYLYVPSGNRVLKVPTQLDAVERRRRLWLTRPDPDWHVQRQKDLLAEGNTYGAAVQVWAEHNARAALALEAGDLDRAWGHLIVAAALKPAAPTPPAIVPPPPATIPLEK